MKEEGISNSGLVKKINLFDATLFVMGSVLGSGIFMTSGHMIGYIGSESLMLGLWLLGGLFTLSGGLCMAWLGIKFPQAGGPYAYLKESYGQWAGFFFGWIFFWVIEGGGIAALSAGFIEHLMSLNRMEDISIIKIGLGGVGLNEIRLTQILAILPIILLSIINHYGIKLAILIQNISMIIRAGLIVIFLTLGFGLLSKNGMISLANFDSAQGTLKLEGIFLAMLATLWTFDGWYAANCTAEEMKNPGKDLPRAIILGILGITAIYVSVNIFYVLALPAESMANLDRVGELAASFIFGSRIAPWMTVGIAVTIFGCLSATIIYGPRVYFAMARDKIFFQSLGRINKKTRVPSQAIWAQAAWSSVLCLVGKFQGLYEYVVFSLLLFFAAIGGAIFIQARKKGSWIKDEKSGSKKITNQSYKLIIAGFFIVCCLLIYSSSLIWKTKEVFIGIIITLSGWPAYRYWQKTR